MNTILKAEGRVTYHLTFFDSKLGYRKTYMQCQFATRKEALDEFKRICDQHEKRAKTKGLKDRLLDREDYRLEKLIDTGREFRGKSIKKSVHIKDLDLPYLFFKG